MNILAIDPGPEESAYVVLLNGKIDPDRFGKQKNESLLDRLRYGPSHWGSNILAIEQVACMGMAVGAEVFETVYWTGRFVQAWGLTFERIKRHQAKMHLCGNMRAKDANIRQALIDKLGKPGNKKAPGGTYGISGDVWSALAIGVTFLETRSQEYSDKIGACAAGYVPIT